MTNHGVTPLYHDLMTPYPEVTPECYHSVMGWWFEAMPSGLARDCRIASSKAEAVVGIMRPPDHTKCIPGISVGYGGMNTVTPTAHKVGELGGAIDMEPMDSPGTGLFTIYHDAQSAKIVFTGRCKF